MLFVVGPIEVLLMIGPIEVLFMIGSIEVPFTIGSTRIACILSSITIGNPRASSAHLMAPPAAMKRPSSKVRSLGANDPGFMAWARGQDEDADVDGVSTVALSDAGATDAIEQFSDAGATDTMEQVSDAGATLGDATDAGTRPTLRRLSATTELEVAEHVEVDPSTGACTDAATTELEVSSSTGASASTDAATTEPMPKAKTKAAAKKTAKTKAKTSPKAKATTTEAQRKRGRSQLPQAPGVDIDGEELPSNNPAGYTPAQAFVFKQHREKMPSTLVEAFDKGTKSQRNELINAMIPRSATHGFKLQSEGLDQWWQRKVTAMETKQVATEEHGFCETGMVAACHGSRELMKSGLAKGDIVLKDDGMYYWKKRYGSTSTL